MALANSPSEARTRLRANEQTISNRFQVSTRWQEHLILGGTAVKRQVKCNP